MPDATIMNIETLAGAHAFDSAMLRLAAISTATFERDGVEDLPTMVAALEAELRDAMARQADFRFGFLLPLTELMDCARMGMLASDGSGAACLARLVRRSGAHPAGAS